MTRRRTTLSACVIASFIGGIAAASAHAILLESQPALNAEAPSGHLLLRLRFNSRIDRARSRLALAKPDGTLAVLRLDAPESPDLLAVTADLPPGRYTLRWQVLATDGHVTRGSVPFTLLPAQASPDQPGL